MTKLSESILNKLDEFLCFSTKSNSIQLHEPSFVNTNADVYVQNCIDESWVSTGGEWVTKFEDSLIKFTGAKFAVAITNGTNALRMSLHVAGVLPGDEVLMPSLSFVATVNAVAHLGAVPHFVDIESNSLGICPNALRNIWRKLRRRKVEKYLIKLQVAG